MTFEEVEAEAEAVIDQMCAENPDTNPDDISHDTYQSYLYNHDLSVDVRMDIARCVLGWHPEEDRDLYRRVGL